MNTENSILIVEDDANSAFVLRAILQKANYSLLPIASSGEMALQLAEEYHPSLLLMDITLSGNLDGIDTALKIKQKYDVPVIYLTGHTSEDVIRRAKASIPFGFLLKPYTAKMVLITTEMALHKASIERESKDTKRRLAVTLGTLQNPIFSTNKDGIITYANPAAQKFLGKSIQFILNQHFDQILPLYGMKNLQQQHSFKDFLDTHLDKVIGWDKNQNKCYLYIQVSSLKDLYNQVQGYVISLNDFTEQFLLRAKESMLASALTSLQEGVIVAEVDPQGSGYKIKYVNQGLLAILKTKAETLIGKPLAKLFCANFNETIIRALEGNCAYTADTIVLCDNGEKRLTNWSLSPYFDNQLQLHHTVITVKDVTQLRKMEENLRQTQKIEAIGRLASGIAHDFNNLLSIINGCTDLAIAHKSSSEKVEKYLKSIHEAGERGAVLIQQLMLFSRKNTEVTQPQEICNPEKTIHKTLEMLRNWLGKSVSLTEQMDTNLWPLKILEAHLDQILVNLCVNAKDAMPNGGKIEVFANNFKGCPQGLMEGSYVQISVRDYGTGMDAETQKKIFEPFFTTKPIGKGTGLGLASVYGLVKRYNGTIFVDSRKEEGSTFTLYLPIHTVKQERLASKTEPLKRCCLQLEETIYKQLKPCILVNRWLVVDETKGNEPCVLVSHDPSADVYVPREFSPVSTIKHPFAIAQILEEMQKFLVKNN